MIGMSWSENKNTNSGILEYRREIQMKTLKVQ
jgi:hypothetical protein